MRIEITDKEGNIFFFAGIKTKVDIVMIDENNFDVHCGKVTRQMKGNAEKLIKLFEEWKSRKDTCFNYDLRLE